MISNPIFRILQKTVQTGMVTIGYPAMPAPPAVRFRGAPSFDFDNWHDARPAAEVCPTEAISIEEWEDSRQVTVDYGL